ncbi:recombinase family protein [Phaeobacter gallaeciensis]|nr:recombinase family protein [Phaeobacter gallaeciensis]MDE4302080.1 recombinase family protein [Phaeobacter gallaeciensis]MDE4306943.1 recombinase family protein [Phaeobacter gallaeciensis]MDE4310938.1 recombinase family protein [Phaeobacter gallaeciensis]MDE4315401.1 recombinase family protein [Phaeobacter gallaeciensis]MDE4319865.1 recombinase family protein [Phaeobacter gallaeciensis]
MFDKQLKQKRTKCVIYCRVSSIKQTMDGAGLSSQERSCRDYAKQCGMQVEDVFTDVISGASSNRPGMNLLLDFLNRVDARDYMVIVDDVSRFARDVGAHTELRNKIMTAGAAIDSPKTKFGVDAESRFLEMLWALLASRDREKNAELSKTRTIARLKNGYWTFSAPVGYQYTKAPGGGKLLVPKEPEASIIREALEGFASGRFQSQAEVKRFLDDSPEFPRPRGAKEVKFDRVTGLLTRVVYAGYLEKPEWGIPLTKAQHEPLIPYETYLINQDRLNGRKVAPARKDIDREFVLRGFLTCSECGYSLTSCWSKSGTGKRYPYYLCHHKGCSQRGKSIARDKLEAEFEHVLKGLTPTATTFELAGRMFRDAWDRRSSNTKEDSSRYRTRLRQIDSEVSSLIDRAARTQHEETAHAYETRIAELRSETAALEEKLAQQAVPEGKFDEMFELSMKFLASPWNIWEKGSYELKRTVLRMAFSDPLSVSRETGLRTVETTLPFKALRFLSTSESQMVPGGGIEPPTRGFSIFLRLFVSYFKTFQSVRDTKQINALSFANEVILKRPIAF